MTETEYPFVSIILLNYNGRRFSKYWKSIFYQDYPKSRYEIVFVDNGSCDGSEVDFVGQSRESKEIKTRIIKLEKNCGYSRANNLGVAEAKGDYVILLSNDIRVSINWLRKAIEALELDKDVAVAQSMMYKLDNASEADEMGNYIDVFGLNHSFPFSREVKEVSYCEGAVMIIRRRVIEEVGGLFDERYFMFYEDVDFCWRARLMGYKVVVVPDSVVYHKRGGTVSGIIMKTDPKYVYCNTRNRLSTLFKNYSAINVIKFVPLAVALEAAIGTALIFSGLTGAAIACYRGIGIFLLELRRDAIKRAVVQQRRKVDDSFILQSMIPAKDALRHLLSIAGSVRNEWTRQLHA